MNYPPRVYLLQDESVFAMPLMQRHGRAFFVNAQLKTPGVRFVTLAGETKCHWGRSWNVKGALPGPWSSLSTSAFVLAVN